LFEIYLFIDPLNTLCFNVEKDTINLAKKRKNFRFRFIPIVNLQTIEQSLNYHLKDKPSIEERNQAFQNAYCIALDIKAAELQGRKYGVEFLLKIQQTFISQNKFDHSIEYTKQCIDEIGADLEAFLKDRNSDLSKKIFLRDQQLARELSIQYIPTAIIFDFNSEEDGIIIEDYLLETLDMLGNKEIKSIYQLLNHLFLNHGMTLENKSEIYHKVKNKNKFHDI
jgi:predicted DsbA family dithiol-disulfide isomerase